jgi:hypothetical protein
LFENAELFFTMERWLDVVDSAAAATSPFVFIDTLPLSLVRTSSSTFSEAHSSASTELAELLRELRIHAENSL